MEDKVSRVNEFIMQHDLSKLPFGLYNGKLGLCIYFFHLARKTGCEQYEKFAEKLLDNCITEIKPHLEIDVRDGLAGFALTISYLIEQGFILGNINTFLVEVDSKIFKELNFNWLDDQNLKISSFIPILFYLAKRIEFLDENSVNKKIIQNIAVDIINRLYCELDAYEYAVYFSLENTMPLYLIALSKLYKLRFFNYKIERIFDKLAPVILSTYPTITGLRLYMYVAINSVLDQIDIPKWKEHARMLLQVDHKFAIDKEFRSGDIDLLKGLSGYIWLLSQIDKHDKTSYIHSNRNAIIQKIQNSIHWNNDFQQGHNLSLMNGFSGVALTYYLLLK